MSSISDEMKQLFIDSYRLYEVEQNYNYLNYGRYPYRDRKSSIKIIADFNENAYSINGLFTSESSYTIAYPPEIIEIVEVVLVQSQSIQNQFVSAVNIVSSDDNQSSVTLIEIESARGLISEYEQYRNIVTTQYVEVEATEIQVLSYVFPFDCVSDGLGRLRLSF
jgi:hypothetical protein